MDRDTAVDIRDGSADDCDAAAVVTVADDPDGGRPVDKWWPLPLTAAMDGVRPRG